MTPQISPAAEKIINQFAEKIGATVFSNYYLTLAVSLFEYIVKKRNTGELTQVVINQILVEVEDKIIDLESIIGEENCNLLADEKAAVINFCFDFYSRSVRSGEDMAASTPKEITSFINNLYTVKPDELIYTPFMGIGSHVLTAPKNYKFIGEEINSFTWALGQINIFANNCNATIKHEDSFVELNDFKTKYDTIIIMPPFGLKDNNRNEYSAIFDAVNNKLNDEGQLFALLPLSFTFSNGGDAFALRKTLMEKKLIAAIITLPPVIGGTTIKPCLLVIKNAPQDGIVFFDFSSLVPKDDFIPRFSYKTALEAIEQRNTQYGKYISYNDIEFGKNLNLSPSSRLYVLPKTSYPVLPLSDLVKPIRQKTESDIEGKFLVIEEPGFETTDEFIPGFSFVKRKIKRGVLVVPETIAFFRQPTMRFANIPTLDISFNEPYIAPIGTEFFEITNNILSKEYLEAALNDKYVMQQIEIQRKDRTMNLRLDISEIFVPIPPKKEQDIIISKFKVNVQQRYARLARIYGERAGILDMAKDLKHMLGTPFNNIFNALALLERMVQSDSHGCKYISQIKDNLEYAQRIIIRDGVNFNDEYVFPKEKINIFDFFERYKNGWENYGSPNFRLEIDYQIDENDYIYGNGDALRIMIDALLENANRHGFLRKYKETNVVKISLIKDYHNDDVPILHLQVYNNGRPFSEDFTLEDFITAGKYDSETGHSGLGGKHIFEITKSFGGNLQIPVTETREAIFQFDIPINPISE